MGEGTRLGINWKSPTSVGAVWVPLGKAHGSTIKGSAGRGVVSRKGSVSEGWQV